MELVRRIRRNVDRLSCMNGRFLAPKRRFNLSIQHNEGLLEVVTVRPRTTARRNVHVDRAKPALCVVSINRDGVGIADQTDDEPPDST